MRSHPSFPRDLLNQDFQAQAPNEKWLADVTYIPTAEGWLYLAVVLDLFSRKIAGWAMDAHHTRHLVSRALQMALQTRQPTKPLLHHSGQGSQYASQDYQALLANAHCQVSTSRTGYVYDNAPLESFFATLKVELVNRRQYPSRNAARSDLFEYIVSFYNRCRRHSALGYLSPTDFEANYVLRLNCLSIFSGETHVRRLPTSPYENLTNRIRILCISSGIWHVFAEYDCSITILKTAKTNWGSVTLPVTTPRYPSFSSPGAPA